MPQLTARKGFLYAGKVLVAGQPFTASRQDARALVAVRHATYCASVPVIETKSIPEAAAFDEDAEQPSPVDMAPAAKQRGRKAKKKD